MATTRDHSAATLDACDVEFFGATLRVRSPHLVALLTSETDDVRVVGQTSAARARPESSSPSGDRPLADVVDLAGRRLRTGDV